MEITVRPGDSYWYYSQLFDVPLILIQDSNPQINPDQLFPGRQIQIPGYEVLQYTITANDSLWSIAMNQNLPIDSLFLLNQMVDPMALPVGSQLFIPRRINELVISDINGYTYEKMSRDIERLVNIYPFIAAGSAGSSVMGKQMTELRVGDGPRNVHINGSFHANEWITTPVIIRFLNEYARALTNSLPLRGLFMLPSYMDYTLSTVPMVNPDGVNLVINGASSAGDFQREVLQINNGNDDFSNWKANIHGVDLNNQFPALWEIESERKPSVPQPRDFPGFSPLSEPESIAMAELANRRDFLRVIAFHTQGEVIFWGFEGIEPPESESIAEEFARTSGYTSIQYVDSYAGYKDWFIQKFRRPGFTIELGRGINPLPLEQFAEIYEESLGIMLANLYL
ncbi:M14 family zinc carboxypeptidase [Virgibacillus xinjiangensis]|uniref:M14 family zinc carboxypeptidase n=1 Tax=Virgibacillus xinjiangensis TaxID=393090 RepID=A0ABV7CR28_9BACI